MVPVANNAGMALIGLLDYGLSADKGSALHGTERAARMSLVCRPRISRSRARHVGSLLPTKLEWR